jgi:hypothetical protein
MKRLVSMAALAALAAAPSAAAAAVKITNLDCINPAVGSNPREVDLATGSFGNFAWDQNSGNASYSYAMNSYNIEIFNEFNKNKTKYALLELLVNQGVDPPVQQPGEFLDITKWPVLSSFSPSVPTCASVRPQGSVFWLYQIQWTLTPQPAREFLNFSKFQFRDRPLSFSFATICVPEPQTWVLMVLGVASLGALVRRRRAAGSPA